MGSQNYLCTTVFEEALKRVRFVFDNCDDVIVSMSGGKDSTVVFNLALMVAKETGRLPLKVFWLDQEAEWQATEDYMNYVMRRKDVKPYWFQIPFDFTNSLSFEDNFLRVWDEEKKDVWIRPHSDIAITENPTKEHRFHKLINILPSYCDVEGKDHVGVLVDRYKNMIMCADCLHASKNIYLRLGFILKDVKHYKAFDVFKVERRGVAQ